MSTVPDPPVVRRGTRGAYCWLTATGRVDMGTLLHLSPEAVLNYYLAVTSTNRGVPVITIMGNEAGWHSGGDIAYSPLITSIAVLQSQRHGVAGCDECYVFRTPCDLGKVVHASPFEKPPGTRRPWVFVRTPGFVLHDPPDVLHEWFWRQMDWIQPESYIADGRDCLTLVSRNKALLDSFHERLTTGST